MATNFSPCKGSYVLNQFPSNVMFGMNGFHVSASGAIQGHHGPLVSSLATFREKYCINLGIVICIFIHMIDCMVFNASFNVISFIFATASAATHGFLELFLPVPHNILSKPLANFPLNHCQNSGQQ